MLFFIVIIVINQCFSHARPTDQTFLIDNTNAIKNLTTTLITIKECPCINITLPIIELTNAIIDLKNSFSIKNETTNNNNEFNKSCIMLTMDSDDSNNAIYGIMPYVIHPYNTGFFGDFHCIQPAYQVQNVQLGSRNVTCYYTNPSLYSILTYYYVSAGRYIFTTEYNSMAIFGDSSQYKNLPFTYSWSSKMPWMNITIIDTYTTHIQIKWGC